MTCAGTNRQGDPCKCQRVQSSDSRYCVWHGPDGAIAEDAARQIFEQLQEIESTPAQRHEIEWLYLRLLPTREQWDWLAEQVCDGPAHGPEDLTREQATELIEMMRYLAARERQSQ